MRSLFLTLLLALASVPSYAQEARLYAVLSLIGDRLQLVQRVPATEVTPERSVVEFIDMQERVFDQTVRIAAFDILRSAEPKSTPVMLQARDPALYAAQAQLLEPGSVSFDALRSMLVGTKATHLVLVTRYRFEAMLPTDTGHVGSGALEGLGFYIDRSKPLIAGSSGEAGYGFLAPFAYFQVSLYDIASRQVVRTERVVASKTLSAARSPEGDPWTTLTSEQKVALLRDMITIEIKRTLPKMVRSIF
jgi:hypothetical protein